MSEFEYHQTKPLVPSWSSTPIPSLSLSAAGLLALADLNTVAQRTVITGGSSWLDALVLAPGLHYQQAVSALDQEFSPSLSAVLQSPSNFIGGEAATRETRYSIANAAMAQYIRRVWQEANASGRLTVNVGIVKDDCSWGIGRRKTGFFGRKPPREIDWLSHVFYLSSPILTVLTGTFMALLADWWGLAFVVALMLSRLLNIWSIKQRSRSQPPAVESTASEEQGEYGIDLDSGARIVLRGLKSDIQAVTTQMWLRKQTVSEGYLEAAAKLIVYLVAAFSGNLSQAGALVLMILLLTSAGLLGLSNAHAKGLRMNGRVARLQGAVAAAAVEQAEIDREAGCVRGALVEDLPTQPLSHRQRALK
ncbi:hypothetical protein AAL_00395 [Moelleriella libera RCEF 2490]|uniref:Uncharacterized protein n=1 Tax=Moelleriella libera RCEF 2490 TaxID=1081109 RepID=A0A166UT81_9HYPO|nr:hypothetical protein AAL_00395 [Moelleriella libera RCEF 2490]